MGKLALLSKSHMGIRPLLVGAVAGLYVFMGTSFQENCYGSDVEMQARAAIIELIEDDLSTAYTYTKSSRHKVPHFEVLDRIFPEWHRGDPATGRKFWVVARYKAFLVHYRVDYVFLTSQVSAIVRGKKLVAWTERKDVGDLPQLWPVQLWSHLTTRRYQDNNYLNSIYAMSYEMKLTRRENGEWVIAEEKLFDNPQMENSLSHLCEYVKQLNTWGLKSDCE